MSNLYRVLGWLIPSAFETVTSVTAKIYTFFTYLTILNCTDKKCAEQKRFRRRVTATMKSTFGNCLKCEVVTKDTVTLQRVGCGISALSFVV
jgi:hypothetical protein